MEGNADTLDPDPYPVPILQHCINDDFDKLYFLRESEEAESSQAGEQQAGQYDG